MNYSALALRMAQAYYGGGATFKVLVATSAYVPNKDTHSVRSDVTNEVSGTNYSAGGVALTVSSIAYNTVTDKVEVTFASTQINSVTLTGARQFVIYKVMGSAGTDELCHVVDNGADVNVTASTLYITVSAPFALNNSAG